MGNYPRFPQSLSHEALIEHFYLSPDDRMFIAQFRGDANRHGAALLLKSLLYLGYFPSHLDEIPPDVKSFMAQQLGLTEDPSEQYPWDSGTRGDHLAQIRSLTGFRFPKAEDKEDLENWLRYQQAPKVTDFNALFESAISRLRSLQIELPAERELTRIVNTAYSGFFSDVHHRITDTLSPSVRSNLDQLLIVPTEESLSRFAKLKRPPGPAGMASLEKEVEKLPTLREVGIDNSPLTDIPFSVQKLLYRRAQNERAPEMRRHPDAVRYGLMACFITFRTMEVIDSIVDMFILMIHRIDTKAQQQRDKQLLRDLKQVEGKNQILFRIAEAVVENPDGTIREVIFPQVGEETFVNLVAEKRASGPMYRWLHHRLMKQKFTHHYRRMLPLVLQHLTFASSNRFQPLLSALGMIKRYLKTSYKYFPVPVPIEGVVTGSWLDTVIERVGTTTKVNRRYYEICVLGQLERALKCKDIWVQGSYEWRNPDEDLPQDWNLEPKRVDYYKRLNQPLDAKTFTETLRWEMTEALTRLNATLPNNNQVAIYFSSRGEKQGLFRVTKPQPQPEPQNIGALKAEISSRYGMLELLDIFVQADELVGFTSFFTHSGIKEVRSRETLRPLILLVLFAEATNIGIKRITNASRPYSYDQLLYVRKHYISPEALREAIRAVVNYTLSHRNPLIWGETNACASDGKRFSTWDENLSAQWRTRYKGYGVVVYWHVETNAVSIYSQLKTYSASEAAAMIEGLIRHDTQMRVEKNFVDSHGQSEVAFAFCRLLNEFKLMPRLKRIKYERLYLPERGLIDQFPNLTGVLSRPIRFPLIEQQYDELMKATVAMKYGDATAFAILKRFSSDRAMSPTYQALVELGKVEKTLFLCNYLPSLEIKQEVHDGLNVVENFNAVNDFIRYGRGGEFATNKPMDMEISMLALHLLQNGLSLINSLLLERTMDPQVLSQRDRAALTPLFHSHVNPYGIFDLDLDKPSFLEAA